MKPLLARSAMAATLLLVLTSAVEPQTDDRTRLFNAPVDRVWAVARSTLKSLGWDVDKEDRDVGWIRTDSRRLEGGDYGVYSKGAKHRLRVLIAANERAQQVWGIGLKSKARAEAALAFVEKRSR